MSNDWLDELLFSEDGTTSRTAVEDAPHAKPEEAPKRKIEGFPRQAHNWGSGRDEVDPFLSSDVSKAERPEATKDDLTPDEDDELRKHEETLRRIRGGNKETSDPVIPPMPTEPPVFPEAEEENLSLIGRIRSSVEKAKVSVSATKGAVAQKLRPVTEKVSKVRNTVDPKQSEKWGVLWSTAAAWVVGPGTLVALYDRIILLLGDLASSAPGAAYLAAGNEPHSWDLMEGLAFWVKETMGAAWEADLVPRVLIAAALGVLPQIVMSFRARWALWTGGLGAVVFIAFFWYPQWWEVHVATLAACSYWGWTMAKEVRYAFLAFLMRIPMVAAVTGTIAYSPGAIF